MREISRVCWSGVAVVILVTVGLFGPSVAQAQSNAALDKGEIFVTTKDVAGSDVPKVVVTGVIDAPPQKVWQIVSDCDQYVKRLPRIKAARQIEKKGDTVICEVTVELPFPLSNLTATTSAKHVTGPKTWSRTWTMIKGDYEQNDGSWVLTAFGDDPQRTRVTYTVHAVPNTSVPGWMRRRAQKSSMPDIIERVREEVKKLP